LKNEAKAVAAIAVKETCGTGSNQTVTQLKGFVTLSSSSARVTAVDDLATKALVLELNKSS
jgi:hypothetical protein